MQPFPYIAKPILNARDAIASHIRWKITLLTAARMREPLSDRATRSIEKPEECSIRAWLLSDYTAGLREHPEYEAALKRHMEFHRTMQGIAKLLNAGHYAEAEVQLCDHKGDFERSSVTLANALMSLDRAQRKKLAS